MNKKILIGLCILSLLMVGCGCNKKKKNTKTVKEATGIEVNFNVVKETEVDGLKFSDVSLVTQDGMSTLEATVTNVSGSTYNLKTISVVFKDKDGQKLDDSIADIGNTLSVDQSSKLNVQTTIDVTKAKDIDYVINK